MGASMELEGFVELQKRLNELGQKGKKVESRAIQSGAKILADTIKKEVPVSDIDHLHIRDDIQVTRTKRKDGVAFADVGPGKETAWRAKFLEFGTVKMPPNPFMSRAEKKSQNEVLAAIKQEIRKELDI
ncbi:hypothetical protein C0971_15705 [Bacillus methanolicus]|uniref:HK97-gp10 family putative phage morphogenesis protein n=1 Tax=Bacillus methanolicus TaxID=1471 RepID=UPI00200D37D5|nr:HK97-gp10 family putative phage morphogenesis protein [Bacillus methanolicus]UQD53305.1 hypothetical protein C0971_15705 [Bacillus methanolicus]